MNQLLFYMIIFKTYCFSVILYRNSKCKNNFLMISYNQNKNEIELTIPVAGIAELYSYQKGLLAILSEVEIDDLDSELKENLKSVYQLLGHLLLDHNFLNQHELLLSEYKDMIVKYVDGRVKGLDD